MDPDANIIEQLRITVELQQYEVAEEMPPVELANRLAELVQALNGWLMRGGALPREWAKGR